LRPVVEGLEGRLLLSSAGDLDTNFGDAGVAEIRFASYFPSIDFQSANAVAVDSSGNIVVAGYVLSKSNYGPIGAESAAVARLTADGSPDANFAPLGQIIISNSVGTGYQQMAGPRDFVESVVQDSEGNVLLNDASDNLAIGSNTNDLVLVGSHEEDGGAGVPGAFSLVALASSSGGQFTDSYGSGTVHTVSFLPFDPQGDAGKWIDVANSGLLQPNGTILLTGETGATDNQLPLARFEIDGSLDASFSANGPQPGTELLDLPDQTSNPNFAIQSAYGGATMAFQGSAHIVLADTALIGSQYYAMALRLNTNDDTIDSSFGDDGVALVPLPSPGTVSGVAVDPASGRIVVAGSNYLVALTSNGQPDTTFGPSSDGVVSIADMTAKAVAIQSDSKIVVVGWAGDIAALARYNVNGSPDTSFGPGGTGLVTTNIDGSGNSTFYTVTTQPSNGEIVAAGTAIDPTTSIPVTVVARYIGETPEISGLSPTMAGMAGPSFTLTVTGDDFVSGSTVDWNGSPLATEHVSDTALTATVPATDLTQAGIANITVNNPGNITSAAQTFTIAVPPAITGLSPSAATQGQGQFSLIVTGNNFVGGATVLWNGSPLTTAFDNGTLTATVPATDLTHVGTASITVINPGNITSAMQTFTIVGPPAITGLSPSSAIQDGAQFALTVSGDNFLAGSLVLWNGAALSTTFVNTTTLRATVPTTDLDQSGSASVTVSNSGVVTPSGQSFTINALPAISGLSPSEAVQGGGQFGLSVTGSNFANGSVVRWNGVALGTTFESVTSLTATVPASDLVAVSTVSITVSNPGNITSTARPFAVVPPPSITGLSPPSAGQGGGPYTLNVIGTDFLDGCTVLWNGTGLSTSFVNATLVMATIPAANLVQTGSASITVNDPGNIASNAKTFTIVVPPAITGLSPSYALEGGGQFSLSVTGSNFINGSMVLWNETALATTFVSATNLTATVPADDLVQPGTASITVSNSEDVTSNAQTFPILAQPEITGLSPASASKGGGQFILTVTGANFLSGSLVLWDGTALKTVFVNAAILTATVPTSELATVGSASISVSNPENVTSSPQPFRVVIPPSITGLSPSSALNAGAPLALTVTGSNFSAGYFVFWNGAALSTAFVSATTLTATIPAADLLVPRTASVTVGDGSIVTSNAETFTVVEQPAITVLSPTYANQGGVQFTLTVSGESFANGSTVQWNGTALATVFVSATTLTATVPASDLVQAAAIPITVNNLGDITSSAQTFLVVGPPAIFDLSKTSATQGTGPLSLTVTGTNFVNGSMVLWNGAALSTAFVSNGTLDATIPASDLAHPGIANVAVSTGNVTSSPQLFTVIGTGPPSVTGITIGSQTPSGLVVSIVVSFNEPMSIGSVQNPSLYNVLGAVTVKRKTKYSKKLSFRVTYNARAMTATLTLGTPYRGGVQVTAKSGIQAANGLSTERSKQSMLT
jgi:uncharacterized delta-60 repeat protein